MADDNQKMIDAFTNMPSEQLEAIVKNKSDDYKEDALKVAYQILKERGASVANATSVPKAKPKIKIEDSNREVQLTGIDIPFGIMVEFIFKWTIASIPTALFIYLIVYLLMIIF